MRCKIDTSTESISYLRNVKDEARKKFLHSYLNLVKLHAIDG